jgi:hypothetical protein
MPNAIVATTTGDRLERNASCDCSRFSADIPAWYATALKRFARLCASSVASRRVGV